MAVMHLASDLTASELAVYHLVLAVHAEGSIEAERMTIVKNYPGNEARAEVTMPPSRGNWAQSRLCHTPMTE